MDMLWSLEQENVNKLFYCKVAAVVHRCENESQETANFTRLPIK